MNQVYLLKNFTSQNSVKDFKYLDLSAIDTKVLKDSISNEVMMVC
jgi:hypothetical protein